MVEEQCAMTVQTHVVFQNLENDSIVFRTMAMRNLLGEFGEMSFGNCYELMQGKEER